MTVLRPWLIAAAGAAASGCAVTPRPPAGAAVITAPADEAALPTAWTQVARPADAARIAAIGNLWTRALAEARGSDAAAEGALLDPQAALPRPAPSPGAYRCRMVKLGRGTHGHGRAMQSFKPFFCFVQAEDALLTFAKASGTQRPAGRLWDDGERRMVFLGAMAADPEARPPAYGANAAADRVGVIERIGDFRWRLTLLPGDAKSTLDVIELLPNTAPPA